jgi:hypothetical protein
MLALAESLPADEVALAEVPGIGPAKIGKYGPSILALCNATSAAGPAESPPVAAS